MFFEKYNFVEPWETEMLQCSTQVAMKQCCKILYPYSVYTTFSRLNFLVHIKTGTTMCSKERITPPPLHIFLKKKKNFF